MNDVRIPPDIAAAVLRAGRVEWGAIAAKPDAEHVSDFADSLQMTREFHGLSDEPRQLHGLYLEGSDTVLCHTGTSPNSPNNARALAGAWNQLHDLCAASAIEAQRAATGTGAVHESAVGTSRDAQPNS